MRKKGWKINKIAEAFGVRREAVSRWMSKASKYGKNSLKSMLARQGIIAEGYSLVDNAPFANKLGFYGYVIFTYNLKNLDHNKKTRFTYALIGRENKEGIIKLTGARVLGKGAVAVPSEKSILFLNFLERWNINFIERKALIEI